MNSVTFTHTHTHTQTKLRIWKHQQFGNQPKTILIQSENAYNETRTHHIKTSHIIII